MLKRFLLPLFSLFLLAIVVPALTGCSAPSAPEAADRAQAAYRGLSGYSGLVEITEVAGESAEPEVTRRLAIAFRKPDLFRIEVLAPEEEAGLITAFDGTTLSRYDPRDGTVYEVTRFTAGLPGDFSYVLYGDLIENLLVDYTLEASEDERPAGQDARMLSLSPRASGAGVENYSLSLYLDPRLWLPIEIEWLDGEGNLRRRVLYREMLYEAPKEETLAFAPPEEPVDRNSLDQPKVTLEEARQWAPFPVYEPEQVPTGLDLEQVLLLGDAEYGAVEMHYTGETAYLRVVESSGAGAQTGLPGAQPVEHEGTTYDLIDAGDGVWIIHWILGETEINLEGNIGRDRLLELAASFTLQPESGGG